MNNLKQAPFCCTRTTWFDRAVSLIFSLAFLTALFIIADCKATVAAAFVTSSKSNSIKGKSKSDVFSISNNKLLDNNRKLNDYNDIASATSVSALDAIGGNSQVVEDSMSQETVAKNQDPLPPLPDPTTNPEDDVYRTLRRRLPKRVQSWMRDSGTCRLISDWLVLLVIPSLLQERPYVLGDFLRLTLGEKLEKSVIKPFISESPFFKESKLNPAKLTVEKLNYGSEEKARQVVSLIRRKDPTSNKENAKGESLGSNDRTIVFVHGGAWGSGFPGMYALAATPFLNAGYDTVALVGYRTFPSASSIEDQMNDVSMALNRIAMETSAEQSKMTLIGHSSGAHVLAMGFLKGILKTSMCGVSIDQFIGLAGVYDINSHYYFEKGRGVERVSAMAKICGYSSSNFRQNSPTYLARACGSKVCAGLFPEKSVFLHGAQDTTVPYSSSQGISDASGLPWQLLPGVGHAEMVLEVMFGGTTLDAILDWIAADEIR